MSLPATEDFTGTTGNQVSTLPDWTNVASDGFDIQSNEAASDSLSAYGADRWSSDTPNADQYAQCVKTSNLNGNYVGPAVRCSDSAETFYGIMTDGRDGQTFLYKVINGSFTQLGSVGGAVGISDVLRVEVEGVDSGTLTPYLNGGEMDPPGAQTDSDIDSGWFGIGCWGTGNSARIDDWEGGNLGAGGISLPVLMAQYRQRWG